MKKTGVAVAVLLMLLADGAAAADLDPAPPGLEARAIAEKVEDVFRGNNSYMEATMTVVSPRLPTPRRVEFRAWDDRPRKRSFIRILAPAKDAGMAFLKLHPNLWNFIPRVERTIRIPPSMMLQSWMGSDFTNDDLVRESSQLDYDHLLLGIDPDPKSDESQRAYVIEYRPHEDAPVVWGKIVTWVDVERHAPLRQDFYDESGEKLRVIRFAEIRQVQGRFYPHRWSLVPLDKEGHETLIEIEEIRFDQDFDERIFNKRNLDTQGLIARMPLELRLAWRNVWRNPRRTGLTVSATVFAVFLVVFFVALAAGLHEKMIEDSVRLHSGHLSVSGKGHLENQTLEQYLELDPGLEAALAGAPGVRGMAPRVVGFGLSPGTRPPRALALFGVDPEREGSVSTLPGRVRRGRFVGGDLPYGIVLGERLSQNLGADLGDQVLVYSVAYSFEMAYELFTVVGIAKLPEPSLERSLAVISLRDAQEFFVYGDRVTEVALLADDADAAPELTRSVAAALPEISSVPAEVHTWDEIMPELVQLMFLDDAGMYILLVILVVVVAFGILNTILMSVLERTRELGVVLALGLRPRAVFRLIYFESMLLALCGLLIGLALAIPAVLYFQAHPVVLTGDAMAGMELFGIEPVMTWKLKPWNPAGSAITIFAVAAIAALYPALKASRGRPVDALRSL